jgi:multiple sugar transport system substrate-binding protein
MPELRGLTWKHDRGLAPLVATAAEFARRRAGVRIEWEARSLHEFGDVSVTSIAGQFDFIVIDHPFMGDVARDGYLLPLDEHIPRETLATLGAESAGASHQSYFYEGHQWALANDAASQVSGYRADLLAEPPTTWTEVLELATTRPGFVTPSLLPLDSMMCFFSLCANSGQPCCATSGGELVDRATGESALDTLRRLAVAAAPDALSSNPIAIWERMSTTDDIAYCPLAFGYSNYSRDGYRAHRLSFTTVPGVKGATLGGAGIAITRNCRDIEAAAEYAAWIAGADCQRTTYVRSAGQPGNKRAWLDEEANHITNGYFHSILPTIEAAWVRPRFPNFIDFQTAAGHQVHAFLRGERDAGTTLDHLDQLWKRASD